MRLEGRRQPQPAAPLMLPRLPGIVLRLETLGEPVATIGWLGAEQRHTLVSWLPSG